MKVPDKLKVLVVGGGGREHALCGKLAQSSHVAQIYCAPGNGGTATTDKTENVNIGVMDIEAQTEFCRDKQIDLVVMGPDDPIAAGAVDHLENAGFRVFGPRKRAAQLEASKAFAKDFMVDTRIPTARYIVCDELQAAIDVVTEHPWARVIKVDGLALGKGVFVCDTAEEATQALHSIFRERKFGDAGKRVVIEEKLQGEELSLLLFCDGKRLEPMPACQDHKRRFDGDRGPNTGGMGAYSPVELYDRCHVEIDQQVLEPLRKALQDGSLDYKGVIFIGIMVESRNLGEGESERIYQPYVLEFNARFGDPETQTLMPLLNSDLAEVLWACTDGKLSSVELEWRREASCCVVACGDKYPETSSKGEHITVEAAKLSADTFIFHAGTKLEGDKLMTNGGRVLAVTAVRGSLSEAIDAAYQGIEHVSFKDMAFRKDIARRAGAACLSL